MSEGSEKRAGNDERSTELYVQDRTAEPAPAKFRVPIEAQKSEPSHRSAENNSNNLWRERMYGHGANPRPIPMLRSYSAFPRGAYTMGHWQSENFCIWHKAAERTCTTECPLLGSLRKRLDARSVKSDLRDSQRTCGALLKDAS